MTHYDKVQEQFNKQASVFSRQPTIANSSYLQWMLDPIKFTPSDIVLDVAAGTGQLSRAIAPYAQEVIALDLTPAMLEQGRLETQEAGLQNVKFEQGTAENLPYNDQSFDVAVTRFSLHHFENPIVALREMWRVLKVGGQIAVIDLVSPDDPELAANYNHFERLRDPSHTIGLSTNALLNMAVEVGFDIVHEAVRDIEVDLVSWLNLTKTPSEARKLIQDSIESELTGQAKTGMRPFKREDSYFFLHNWVTVVGIKKSKG